MENDININNRRQLKAEYFISQEWKMHKMDNVRFWIGNFSLISHEDGERERGRKVYS